LEKETLKKMQTRIVKNFLDIIIMAELRNRNPLSGYDVIDFIHKKFDILISSGTVYALLYYMEREGLIKGVWVQRKRAYTLTDKGRETINAISKLMGEIQIFIRSLISVEKTFSMPLSQ